MPIDYSKSAAERYAEIIVTSELQEDIDQTVITFGPAKESVLYGYNTRTTARATKGSVLRNCIAMYVNRIDLNTFFTDLNATSLSAPGAVTSHDILPIILSEYGVKLTVNDIVLDNLADTNFTITAKPTSLGWLNSFQFNATIPVFPPLLRTLTERLIVTSTGLFIRKAFPAYNP